MDTGIKVFDDHIGGMTKEKVNIIGTKATFGKTTLMSMVAYNAHENGHGVLFITHDLPEVVFGMITNMTPMKLLFKRDNDLIVKTVDYDYTTDKLIEFINKKENIDLVILDGIILKGSESLDISKLNENVKPTVMVSSNLITLANDDSSIHKVDYKSLTEDNSNIFTINQLGDYTDGVKQGEVMFNGKIVSNITIDYNNFKVN